MLYSKNHFCLPKPTPVCLQLSSKHFPNLLNSLSLCKPSTPLALCVSILSTCHTAVPEPAFCHPLSPYPSSCALYCSLSLACTKAYPCTYTHFLFKGLKWSCSKVSDAGGNVCTLFIPNEQNCRNPLKHSCWDLREACWVVISNPRPPGCVTSVWIAEVSVLSTNSTGLGFQLVFQVIRSRELVGEI